MKNSNEISGLLFLDENSETTGKLILYKQMLGTKSILRRIHV